MALLKHTQSSQTPNLVVDNSMMKQQQKIYDEEGTDISMNGWDSFVDHYLIEKRNIEKQKPIFPSVSKSKISLANEKKQQRGLFALAQVMIPAFEPSDSRNNDDGLIQYGGTSLTLSKFNRKNQTLSYSQLLKERISGAHHHNNHNRKSST